MKCPDAVISGLEAFAFVQLAAALRRWKHSVVHELSSSYKSRAQIVCPAASEGDNRHFGAQSDRAIGNRSPNNLSRARDCSMELCK